MLSRVTIDASSASVNPDILSGLLGITIYLISAVLSCTRTVVLSGKITPNSVKTERGSLTADFCIP